MFQLMSKDYFSEIENMMKRIELIDTEIENLKIIKDDKKEDDEILKKYKHIKELNKVIIDEFIDKVYIENYDGDNLNDDEKIYSFYYFNKELYYYKGKIYSKISSDVNQEDWFLVWDSLESEKNQQNYNSITFAISSNFSEMIIGRYGITKQTETCLTPKMTKKQKPPF